MFDRILFTWSHNVRRRNNNLQETNKQNEKNWQRISQISIFSLFSDKRFSVLRQKKTIIKNKIEKVQPSSSHNLSAFERFSKNLINSPKKTKKKLMKCSTTPEESEPFLRSTCYLPERSHLILFAALAGPPGLSTPDCLAVFQTGFLLLWDWGFLVVQGLCISKIALDR